MLKAAALEGHACRMAALKTALLMGLHDRSVSMLMSLALSAAMRGPKHV